MSSRGGPPSQPAQDDLQRYNAATAHLEPAAARAAETAASGLAVDVRGRAEPARLTPLPFYHRTSSRT